MWAAFIVVALAASALIAQGQANFSPPINISNTSGNSMSQQIAVDSRGDINVVWTDNTPGNYVLLFSRSTDGGSTFSTPLNVSNNTSATVEAPHIATDQAGNIYVGWEDWVSSTNSSAQFSRSVNGGATFSTPTAISNGTAASAPRIAIDPTGAIDFAWSDNSAGYASVFFSRSTDQGNTFSTPVNISNNPSGAGGPYLSLDPAGDIYIAWVGNATFNGQLTSFVYFSGATEGSNAFSTPAQVSVFGGPFAQLGSAEVAAISASNIDVVWAQQSNGSSTLFSANSVNGGTSFSSNLTAGSGEYAPYQQIAIDPRGGVDIAWQASGGNGSATVYFGRTTGGALTVTNVATIGQNTPSPQIAVDARGKINLIFYGYQTQSGGAGVQYTQSTNSGATFSPVESISTDAGQLPQIALNSGGNSYVVWQAGENVEDVFFSTNAPAPSAPGGVPSFSVAASPTALTIMAPGQTASTILTFSSKGGFAGAGTLASSNCGTAASTGITCSLTAFTLPANGTATATLTFTTTAPSASAAGANVRNILITLLLGLGVLYPLATRRRERCWSFAFAAVLFAVLISGVGCGTASTGAMNSASGSPGSAGDPPGNSGTPVGAVSSVTVPIVINGAAETVPGLTLMVQ